MLLGSSQMSETRQPSTSTSSFGSNPNSQKAEAHPTDIPLVDEIVLEKSTSSPGRKRRVGNSDEKAMQPRLGIERPHARHDNVHDHRSEDCFKELLRVAEAHLSSHQKSTTFNAIEADTDGKPNKRARAVERLQLCNDSHCSSSFCNINDATAHCTLESCTSRQASAPAICPIVSPCCNGEQSKLKESPNVVACQDVVCLPAIPCEDARCLSQDCEATASAISDICTEPCDLGLQLCSVEAARRDIPAAEMSNCLSCEQLQPTTNTFQEMLDCWCCSDQAFEQCCPSNTINEICDDCCLETAAPIRYIPNIPERDHQSNDSRSRTTSISISSLGSPGASIRSYATTSSFSNAWSQGSILKQEEDYRNRQMMRCIFDEDHMHNEVGACIPPGLTTYSSNTCNDSTNSLSGLEPFTCHWAGCGMQCHSVAHLWDHVYTVHLSLPTVPAVQTTSNENTFNKWTDQSQYLRCMWDSCQMEQGTTDTFLKRSWEDSKIILQHILQAHIGVEEVPLTNDYTRKQPDISMSNCTSRETSTLTSSEDDNGEHRCEWQDCTLCFDNHEALTEHITRDHVGSGKGQYECLWRGCSRGQRVFHQKQKMLRHLQTHTHHRPFVCQVCQKRFSEANTLSQHLRTHTNEKPYQCDFPGCGKSFAVAGSLTIHKRIHSGEKPFKCTWPGCNKAFAESSNLAKHHRIHSGARPFICTIDGCQLSFSRSDQLTRHKKTHEKGVKMEG